MYVREERFIAERIKCKRSFPRQSRAEALPGQLVDLRLDVFKHAQENHVVDARPNEYDGKAFVHAGFSHSHGGLADFLRLA